jgi:hypothetical protein
MTMKTETGILKSRTMSVFTGAFAVAGERQSRYVMCERLLTNRAPLTLTLSPPRGEGTATILFYISGMAAAHTALHM